MNSVSGEKFTAHSTPSSDDEWEDLSDGEDRLKSDVDAPATSVKKRKLGHMSKDGAEKKLELAKSSLKSQFHRLRLVSSWSFADETVAAVASLVPYEFEKIATCPFQSDLFYNLVGWFRHSFKVIDRKHVSFSEGRDGCAWEGGLDNVLRMGAGTGHQLVQIFVALLSALRIPVRYVCTVDPPSSDTSEPTAVAWAEVRLSDGGSTAEEWINVDPISGIINDKLAVETLCRPRRAAVVFVFAVDRTGCVADVTSAYACNPVRTRQKRGLCVGRAPGATETWWTSLLESEHQHQSVSSTQGKVIPAAASRVLPTSIAACRDHPVYAVVSKRQLDQHVLILRPGAQPVGIVDGQRLYLRNDVSVLLTALQWRRGMGPGGECRQVIIGEEPCASRTRSQSRPGGGDGVEGTGVLEELFAEWQTRPLSTTQSSSTVDLTGNSDPTAFPITTIPVNEHGNIELLKCTSKGDLRQFRTCGCLESGELPAGFVHIPSVYAERAVIHLSPPSNNTACKSTAGDDPNGIPFAPAVTGFRSIGVMKYKPQVNGIVVREEHAEVVFQVASAMAEEKELLVELKRVEKIAKRWEKLYLLLMTREELRVKYGS